MTAALETICDLAEAHGGGAKPSGAGGGDCAVALFPSTDAAAAFEAACIDAGFPVVPLGLSAGAHIVGT